jgi:hypothetical protein
MGSGPAEVATAHRVNSTVKGHTFLESWTETLKKASTLYQTKQFEGQLAGKIDTTRPTKDLLWKSSTAGYVEEAGRTVKLNTKTPQGSSARQTGCCQRRRVVAQFVVTCPHSRTACHKELQESAPPAVSIDTEVPTLWPLIHALF